MHPIPLLALFLCNIQIGKFRLHDVGILDQILRHGCRRNLQNGVNSLHYTRYATQVCPYPMENPMPALLVWLISKERNHCVLFYRIYLICPTLRWTASIEFPVSVPNFSGAKKQKTKLHQMIRKHAFFY